MKLKLQLGNVHKEYEIGNNTTARAAISAYQRYIDTNEHKEILTCNGALFALLADPKTSKAIKENICNALSEHSLYKGTSEQDIYKAAYFLSTCVDCFMHANLPAPLGNRNLQETVMATLQHYMDKNPKFNHMDSLRRAGMAILDAPQQPKEANVTQESLVKYTKKFFAKHDESQVENSWKPFPKDKILTEGMKGNDVRFIKMGLEKDGLATSLVGKLAKHGFWAQKSATSTGVFVTANVTRSIPAFKKPL